MRLTFLAAALLLSAPTLAALPQQARLSRGVTSEKITQAVPLLEEAAETTADILDPREKASALLRIGDVFWQIGQRDHASALFDHAAKILSQPSAKSNRDSALPEQDVEFDLFNLASARARIGELSGAQRMLSSIHKSGLRDSLLDEIALAQAAQHLFDDAVASASSISDTRRRDKTLYWVSSHALRSPEIDGADKIIRRIQTPEFLAGALVRLADYQAELGRIEASRLSLQEGLDAASRITTANEHERAGGPTFCLEDSPNDPKGEIFARAAGVFTSLGDRDAAEHLLQSIQSKQQWNLALVGMAARTIKSGDLGASQSYADRITSDACRAWAYTSMASELAKLGKRAEAERVAQSIQDPTVRAYAYRFMASSDSKTESPAPVRSILDQAVTLVPRISDPDIQLVSLVEIATLQRNSGDESSARRTLAQAATLPSNDWGLQLLAEAQAHAGEVDAALNTAGRIGDSRREAVLEEIAKSQTGHDNSTATLSWLHGLSQPYDRVLALVGAARGLLHLDQPQF